MGARFDTIEILGSLEMDGFIIEPYKYDCVYVYYKDAQMLERELIATLTSGVSRIHRGEKSITVWVASVPYGQAIASRSGEKDDGVECLAAIHVYTDYDQRDQYEKTNRNYRKASTKALKLFRKESSGWLSPHHPKRRDIATAFGAYSASIGL